MAVLVKGGGGKPEEEKTVTAGTSVIEVNPSSGKVMKKVTVNPTPTESKSVTPTTSELTVTPSEGKHLSQVVVGAVEDVTPEVNAQTPVITQILEGLVGKAQGATATADKILEGYSAYIGQQLVNGTLTKSGMYVWKKLTADGGDFIDFVVSDNESAYPDGGTQDGYWYEKVKDVITPEMFGFTKMAVDTFIYSTTTSGNTSHQHSLGEIPKMVIIRAKTKPPVNSGKSVIENLVGFNNDKFYYAESLVTYSGNYGAYGNNRSGTTSSVVQVGSSELFAAGVEYELITMA